MKKPKPKFVEPETIDTHVWENENGQMLDHLTHHHDIMRNARIIREKDYQRLLKQAKFRGR